MLMMKLTVKGTSLNLTPEVTAYLEKRLAGVKKLIGEHDEAVTMDIELGRTTSHHRHGDIFRAEVNIYINQKTFRAAVECDDIFSAIDEVKDEILSELRSHKTKRLNLLRRGGQKLKSLLRGFNPWRRV